MGGNEVDGSAERTLLLSRINHLDSLAMSIRQIGVTVFLAVFGACVSISLHIVGPNVYIPGAVHFVLPLYVAFVFWHMEARVRTKYEPARNRWNTLAARYPQTSNPFDWMSSKFMSSRHFFHREQTVVYGAMVLIAFFAGVWFASVQLFGWLRVT